MGRGPVTHMEVRERGSGEHSGSLGSLPAPRRRRRRKAGGDRSSTARTRQRGEGGTGSPPLSPFSPQGVHH
ncbi:Hypothetical predicted protein [Podarcis lilfordi]|uniref:Uncharacterized protein n=1 Tax=Podarcis lilfordi TaxID=74358 RepID=A0AA35NVB5_9SAUR|nr:Hypothetical predicted protein [Podarcis lilfordi]